ncbi:D-lactate dehydrogenase (cytochrome) [Burkholderiales bacterium]|nr:D-lactate dehydrogenase (cytochrome) [Burkholderiales bacterium]
MADPGATLLARLRSVVGSGNVLTAAADVGPHVTDWRGRYRGAAVAVVRPASTAEVSAVVSACADARVPIVPQGGNTGLVGGATPHASGDEVVVSLVRMRRIRAVDPDNATLTAEAGVTLAGVQSAAREAGLRFPLSLASEGSCTIGGNLATNAGGTAVLRYGNARDLVLGIEVVLADGSVLDLARGLRKDNTGYDLKQLFVGAEGTLGIVTAAVLKLYAAARTQVTALAALARVGDAIAFLRHAKQALGDRLVGFELVSDHALALSRKHHPGTPYPLPGHPWYALVQADDSAEDPGLPDRVESMLGAALERGIVRDATVASSVAQAAALWAARDNISEAQRREGPNLKHDIALPVSSIPGFLDTAERELAAAFPGVRFVVFGHLGDGNLHYNLSAPPGTAAEAFVAPANLERAQRIVHDLVAARGGSISAEHGIGQLKRGELARTKAPLELEIMRRIKAALDPAGILNPGKIL